MPIEVIVKIKILESNKPHWIVRIGNNEPPEWKQHGQLLIR